MSKLNDFFAEHYPGVSLTEIVAKTPAELQTYLQERDGWACLYQRDLRWKYACLGDDSCTLTIGQAGCFVTGLAEALRHYDIDPDATPLSVVETLRAAGGFSGCRVSKINPLGITSSVMTTEQAKEWVSAGNVAMIEVKPTSLEHWVLAISELDGDWLVCNPWNGQVGWLSEMYPNGVESWRKLEPLAQPVTLKAGLHDAAGMDWMVANGVQGVGLAMAVVRDAPLMLDYRRYQDAGIEVYVRLGWGYADGTGTIPPHDKLADWIRAMAGTVNQIKGVAGVIITNEWNNPSEWPGGWPNPSYVVSPEYCGSAFHSIRLLATADVPLALAALDPFNVVAGQFGIEPDPANWALYLYNRCQNDIGFIALHAKTQGSALEQITGAASYETFTDPPLVGRFQHLRTLEDQLNWIPVQLRDLPIIVTELNPQRRADGSFGWDANGAEWTRAALDYVRSLQRIQGAVLYRYEKAGDQAAFGLEKRTDVLDVLRE